jgi:signal transduction histidine kinase
MSKRPTTGSGVFSRFRTPMGRLRDLPIWSKLGLIMIVPTIATIVVGTAGLVDNINRANDADRARTLANLSANAGTLVHELQNERALATFVLGIDMGSNAPQTRTDFERQSAATDEAVKAYSLLRSSLSDLPESLRAQLGRIDAQLSELERLRGQVKGPADITLSLAVFRYRVLIADLLSLRDVAAELAKGEDLGADLRSVAAISNVKEHLSLERIVVLRAISQHALSPELRRAFIGTLTGQEQALLSFNVVAPPDVRTLYEQTVTGADLREAVRYQGMVEGLSVEVLPTGDDFPTAAQWDSAMVGKARLVRKVEAEIDRHIVDDATVLRDALQRTVLLETGLLLGMLLLAILFAWMVARSMARSLRELRHGALTVAQYGLPQAVARLRDPTLTSQMSAQQVAVQIAEPLPVRSRDEFGQVAEAFNAVHLEAVRTAAEQAALRASVATMFVNLARRSQILVDRLIGHLDRLERGEEDPDRLAELFQLDHLATRMRRNDENLLVLAGADSTRIQREPAPLMDVLRAAQSEVEHYTRIEFGMIDRDVEIAAHAVNDMVHLIAELLDNATAFSSPETAVMVEARRLGDRAVLLIEDRGIGVSPDQLQELNERLANPPMVDVAVSRMMGLVVVARLAARHGVKVELRPARDRGTIADVTLPAGVLVSRALPGRPIAGVPLAGTPITGVREPVLGSSGPRSPFAPLALESGPSAGPPRDLANAGNGLAVAGWGDFSTPMTPMTGGPVTGGPVTGGLGAALSSTQGPGFTPPSMFNSPPPPQTPRALPPWSDLTGVNGADLHPPTIRPASGDPLPQRRSGDHWTAEPQPPTESPFIPRQRPSALDPQPTTAPPADVEPPVASAAPAPPAPVVPAPIAPPAWPPVAPPTDQPAGDTAGLDSTAEIPRVRIDWETDGTSEATYHDSVAFDTDASSRDGAIVRQPYADETMELPIFRELESAWFRSRETRPVDPVSPAPYNGGTSEPDTAIVTAEPDDYPDDDYYAPDEREPVAAVPVATSARPVEVEVEPDWHSPADEGWRAASALAAEQEYSVTDTGLPKRVPMSQLVPGGVDRGAAMANRRTPEAVRGLLAAYHRGVQRGRSQQNKSHDPKTPEPTKTGPQNSQAGKEQEA